MACATEPMDTTSLVEFETFIDWLSDTMMTAGKDGLTMFSVGNQRSSSESLTSLFQGIGVA